MDLTEQDRQLLYKLSKKDKSLNISRNVNSSILIIDGVNLFIRSWCSDPTMNNNGEHVGGILGSLKSIGYAIKLLCPTRCIVVFDGIGGSKKRKEIYPNYKEGRKNSIRLNRTYVEDSTATEEEKNRTKQYLRLTQYLQNLPVNLLSINYVEADDVIAYLALDCFKDSNKIYIMSTDKDFLQLCTERINIYSPTKKRIYGPKEVLDEYKIHPTNFILYKALNGDTSDNIDGIKGVGPKTIIKYFPWLNEESKHTVDDIISGSMDLRNKYSACNTICENRSILDRNVELMQLNTTYLGLQSQLHCNECMSVKNIPHLNRVGFLSMIREDSMGNAFPNNISWMNEIFSSLDFVIRE